MDIFDKITKRAFVMAVIRENESTNEIHLAISQVLNSLSIVSCTSIHDIALEIKDDLLRATFQEKGLLSAVHIDREIILKKETFYTCFFNTTRLLGFSEKEALKEYEDVFIKLKEIVSSEPDKMKCIKMVSKAIGCDYYDAKEFVEHC